MSELQTEIQSHEAKFVTLLSEINNLKSGQLDDTIRAELRSVLARKFGKRLLDSWVPEVEDVKVALEKGMPEEEELRREVEGVNAVTGNGVPTEQTEGVEPIIEQVVEKTSVPASIETRQGKTSVVERSEAVASPTAPRSKRKQSPIKSKTDTKPLDNDAARVNDSAKANEAASSTASNDKPISKGKSRRSVDREAQSSKAISVVEGETKSQLMADPEDEPVEEGHGTRASKRKASTQPKGAPPSKRSVRKGAAKTPTPAPVEQVNSPVSIVEEETNDPTEFNDEKEDDVVEADANILEDRGEVDGDGRAESDDGMKETDCKVEKEAEEDGEESKRKADNSAVEEEAQAEHEEEHEQPAVTPGRRSSRRTGRGRSPTLSISGLTKGSSPAPSRRAPSVSSTRSTPIPSTSNRRSSVRASRGLKEEGKVEKGRVEKMTKVERPISRSGRMRDSRTVESVKEEAVEDEEDKEEDKEEEKEEEKDERPSKRTTRRGKVDAEEEEAEPVEAPRSSRRGKDKDKDSQRDKQKHTEEEEDEQEERNELKVKGKDDTKTKVKEHRHEKENQRASLKEKEIASEKTKDQSNERESTRTKEREKREEKEKEKDDEKDSDVPPRRTKRGSIRSKFPSHI